MMRSLMLACVLVGLAGCSESSPPAGPTPASPVAGTWTGTVSGAGAIRTVRVVLTATVAAGNTSSAGGTYESVASGAAINGEAAAVVAGSSVSVILTPVPPRPCGASQPFPTDQMLLNLTLDGSRMSGDGAITLCGGSEPAQASFTRQ